MTHKELNLALHKPLLTTEEFRKIGIKEAIGRNQLYRLLQDGKIKHIRVGRKIFLATEIEDFPKREAEVGR